MIPKIDIKYLENDIYTIKPANNTTASIQYIDFNYIQPLSPSTFGTITPNVYQKNIKLKTLEIFINPYSNNIEQEVFNYIKNEINKDFFRMTTTVKKIEKIHLIILQILILNN